MKQLTRLLIVFVACNALVLTAFADGLSATASWERHHDVWPQLCNWTGFYAGINAGGVFGTSDASDFEYNTFKNGDKSIDWSYDVSGFTGGGQLGYNFQVWKSLVLGVEVDGGYLGVDGSKREPLSPGDDTFGKTEGAVYSSWRGRVGMAVDNWLLYVTGGGFGSNAQISAVDDCNTGPCGPSLGGGSSDDFRVGLTVGGGFEYCFNPHWSVRVEYLYFDLGTEDFTFTDDRGFPYKFDTETDGHIVRSGLNFKF